MAKAKRRAGRRLRGSKPFVKKAAVPARGLIDEDPNEPKSGCLWCPLFPFAEDSKPYIERFQRDHEKILDKDEHAVRNRGVGSFIPWDEVDLLLVGEAPGAMEDRKDEAFIGKSGQLLRSAVKEFIKAIPEDRIAYTNTVRCRPPRNRNPSNTIIKCCGYELVREIAARKPKLIMALGNTPLSFLAGQEGITRLTGHMLKCVRPEFPDQDVLACLHPAYVSRADFEIERFAEAFALADEYLAGDYEPLPGAGEYFVLEDVDEVESYLTALREDKLVVAFDTETGSLSPFDTTHPHMLCFSFSNEEGTGVTIPLDHKDSPWHKGSGKRISRSRVMKALRDFFTDESAPKVAQNEKFDRKHIRHCLGVEPTNVVRDTMCTHYTLDERRGTHGLKALAFTYTGMGGYERGLEEYQTKHPEADVEKDGSYAEIPGDLLFEYAAQDADVTLRVDNGLLAEAEYQENPALRALSESLFPQLSIALSDLEYVGATVDTDLVGKLDAQYTLDMRVKAKQIQKLPKIRAFVAAQTVAGKTGKRKNDPFVFNPGSRDQLAIVLFDYYGLKPIALTDGGFDVLRERHSKLEREYREKRGRAPSFDSVMKDSMKRKEWGNFTTKADTLYEYVRKGNELAPLILKFRELQTIHSTFIEPLRDKLDADNRVHGNFWIFGTVTGRLSSNDPNLQNIPSVARPVYISRFGDQGVILQLDYSQIELRVAASWFNDPTMIQAYLDGIDLHELTAADMHHLALEEFRKLPPGERKAWRTRAKRINFGTLYGGGPPALQATLRKDGVFVSLKECEKFIEEYFRVRPDLKRAIERLERETKKLGYLSSFTGRLRRVPEALSDDPGIVGRALRQSVNFPIQNGASEMTLMALTLIHQYMRREKLRSKMIFTVHDSLIFDCHVDEVLDVALNAKYIMEHIMELSDDVLPGLDWSWLKVPIVADCEMGHNWGSLVGFDPATVIEGKSVDTPMIQKGEVIRAPVDVDELWDQMVRRACR